MKRLGCILSLFVLNVFCDTNELKLKVDQNEFSSSDSQNSNADLALNYHKKQENLFFGKKNKNLKV